MSLEMTTSADRCKGDTTTLLALSIEPHTSPSPAWVRTGNGAGTLPYVEPDSRRSVTVIRGVLVNIQQRGSFANADSASAICTLLLLLQSKRAPKV